MPLSLAFLVAHLRGVYLEFLYFPVLFNKAEKIHKSNALLTHWRA